MSDMLILLKKIYVNMKPPLSYLLISVVIFIFFWMSIADNRLKNYIPNNFYRLFVLLFILLAIIIIRFIRKIKKPKNNIEKSIWIIVAIHNDYKDEDSKKIKESFIRELRNITNNEWLNINIIELPNHQCEYLNLDKIKKLNQSIEWHYYIYWEIKKWMEWEEKYFIETKWAIFHDISHPIIQEKLKKDFAYLYPKDISIQKKYAFWWIKSTWKLNFLVAKYIIGFASLYSHNPLLAYELHTSLIKDIKSINPDEKVKTNNDIKYFTKIKERLYDFIPLESYIICSYYLENKKFIEMEEYLETWLKYNPNYWLFLEKAIYEFSYKKDIVESLKSLRKAWKMANRDSIERRYNRIFILLREEKYEYAYREMKNVLKKDQTFEELFLNNIQKFIYEILKEDDSKVQYYFWLGLINYKKYCNYELALKDFNKFINSNLKWMKIFIQPAKTHIYDLEKLLKK